MAIQKGNHGGNASQGKGLNESNACTRRTKGWNKCLCDIVGPGAWPANPLLAIPTNCLLPITIPYNAPSHPLLGNSEKDSGLTSQSPLGLVFVVCICLLVSLNQEFYHKCILFVITGMGYHLRKGEQLWPQRVSSRQYTDFLLTVERQEEFYLKLERRRLDENQ